MGQEMKIENLRHDASYDEMAKAIRRIAGRQPLIFSPSTGNWGDGLINFGSRQFLEHYRFAYQEVHKSSTDEALASGTFRDQVVVLGGGGAWSRNFSLARSYAEKISRQAKEVIVLPTTYDLKPLSAPNVTYFARDRYTSMTVNPSAQFAHDMAFFTALEVPDAPEKAWRLFALRDDREGQGLSNEFPHNFDVSRMGDGNTKTVRPFYNIVNNFSIVTTDRMHVAIVGAMLGIRVNLIAGNYAKSPDVYRTSIQPNYPRVQLKTPDEIRSWVRG